MWLGGVLLLIPLETLMVLSHKGFPFFLQDARRRQHDLTFFSRM
jgi:hypothetical protein